MKKAALMILAAGMLIGVNSFATDGGKNKADCHKESACAAKEKSCCKKPAKAALLKAKPKAEVKKVA